MLLEMDRNPDSTSCISACAVLNGRDQKLLKWITDAGVVSMIADNYAVEAHPAEPGEGCCSALPLHEHCLFKLGVNLGEIWHLTPLADGCAQDGRNRFLLTAPPLRLAGRGRLAGDAGGDGLAFVGRICEAKPTSACGERCERSAPGEVRAIPRLTAL